MKRNYSAFGNTWFLFFSTEIESQEESVQLIYDLSPGDSEEDESQGESDAAESFEEEESSEDMVDPARTGFVDPARTGFVDPART